MRSANVQGCAWSLEVTIADAEDANIVDGSGDQVGYDSAGLGLAGSANDPTVDLDMMF
jgi:hypothetical protein